MPSRTDAVRCGMQIESVADIVRAHSAAGPMPWRCRSASGRSRGASCTSGRAALPSGLARRASDAQDRVAFLDKNGIEHFEVVYGAALGNAVCVDVNWRLAPPEVAFIVNDSAGQGARRRPRLRRRCSTPSAAISSTTR